MWELLQQNWATLLPLATGALGVLALLPQPRRLPSVVGVGLLVVTFVLATLAIGSVTTVEKGLFYGFSFIAIVAGVLLVTQTQPARAALSFTLVVLATCGLFLLLAAPFLFAATIIVYAGAIVVIFLFVLMLAQQTGRDDADLRSREPLLAVVTGFVLLGTLFYLIEREKATTAETPANAAGELRRLIDVARRAREAATPEQLRAVVDSAAVEDNRVKRLPELFLEQTRQLSLQRNALEAFEKRIEDEVTGPWATLPPDNGDAATKERRAVLEKIQVIGTEALALEALAPGALARSAPERSHRPLSQFSGPVGVPTAGLRTGPDGKPAMPAENPTYLGKSLFTDYILPVELGGILLLVAVVGAIVIAQRQDEQGKEIE